MNAGKLSNFGVHVHDVACPTCKAAVSEPCRDHRRIEPGHYVERPTCRARFHVADQRARELAKLKRWAPASAAGGAP